MRKKWGEPRVIELEPKSMTVAEGGLAWRLAREKKASFDPQWRLLVNELVWLRELAKVERA